MKPVSYLEINRLTGQMLEDLAQWMVITNVGTAAKMILDVGSALESGISWRALLKSLRGT
jgi:hypothetical protein